MTFVLVGLRRSGNFLLKSALIKIGRNLALQALFPLRRGLRPAWELLRKFRSLGLPPLLPALQEGRIRGGGLRVHLVLCPVRLPLLPLDLGLARGGGVSLDVRALRASAPLSLQLLWELERGEGVARSQRTPPARAASSVASPRSREVSVDRSFSRSSRVSRSSDRGTRKDRRARSRSDSSRDCSRRSRSRSAYRSQSSGRERRGGHLLGRCPPASGRDLRIAPAPGACTLALGETGLDPRVDTGLAETTLSVAGLCLLTATDPIDSVCVPLLAGELAVTRFPSSFS